MGLPIYRDSPSAAPRAPSPPATKRDPTTHARSAIRRQPTIRHRPAWNTEALMYAVRDQRSRTRTPDSVRNAMEELARESGNPAAFQNALAIPSIALHRSASPPPAPADEETNEQSRFASSWVPQSAALDDLVSPHHQSATPPRPRSRYGPGPTMASADMSSPRRSRLREGPRRRPRRQTTLPPAPEVNGLGDRQRSWSPESENDQWDTLLTTITPDPSLPSASTSFGSTQHNEPDHASNTRPRSTHLSADTARSRSQALHNQEYIDGQHRMVQERLQQHVRQQRPRRHVMTRSSLMPFPRTRSPMPLSTLSSDRRDDYATNPSHDRAVENPQFDWLPIEPGQTLASPSATSDSEEAASHNASHNQAGQVSDSGSHTTDEDATLRGLSDMSDHVLLRTNHAEQLRTFNETYMDYVAMCSYTDRYDLSLAPDNDLASVIRSLASTERLLRRNLARQERYLFSSGVPSRWEVGNDDSLAEIIAAEQRNIRDAQNPSPPPSNDREDTSL